MNETLIRKTGCIRNGSLYIYSALDREAKLVLFYTVDVVLIYRVQKNVWDTCFW